MTVVVAVVVAAVPVAVVVNPHSYQRNVMLDLICAVCPVCVVCMRPSSKACNFAETASCWCPASTQMLT